jgi:endonuclease/exonuclease/phosphatase family metal-dependent hydrolase
MVDAPRELTAIDHILLSPRLHERTRAVTYTQFYDPTTHTDHFPIVVTLASE